MHNPLLIDLFEQKYKKSYVRDGVYREYIPYDVMSDLKYICHLEYILWSIDNNIAFHNKDRDLVVEDLKKIANRHGLLFQDYNSHITT